MSSFVLYWFRLWRHRLKDPLPVVTESHPHRSFGLRAEEIHFGQSVSEEDKSLEGLGPSHLTGICHFVQDVLCLSQLLRQVHLALQASLESFRNCLGRQEPIASVSII